MKRGLLPTVAREALCQYPNHYLIEHELKKGGHLCDIVLFDELMDIMQQPGPKYIHEVIHPDSQCRFYMDCEKYEDGIDPEEYTKQIHQHVIQVFGVLPQPHAFQCIRPGKFSIHLIWDMWLDNPNSVFEIVKMLPDVLGVKPDLQVYPQGFAPRTFRMPWCSKKSGAGPLLPLGALDATFDPLVFCKGLVTFDQNASKNWPLPIAPAIRIQPSTGKQVKKLRHSKRGESNPVLDWMQLTIPNFEWTELQYGPNKTWQCYSSMYCTTARRRHLSNKTYIHCQADGKLYSWCSDIECRKKVYFPYTSFDIEISLSKLEIDF